MNTVNEFIDDLKSRGYSVKFDASIKGESGTTHHVDVLAMNSRGKKVIGQKRGTKAAAVELINTFVVALDSGADAFYVVNKEIDEQGQRLAGEYKIALLTP